MAELLFEIRSEEIPARMQERAAEELCGALAKALADGGLPAQEIDALVTPRRLVVFGQGILVQQPDRTEERKGPRLGAPEKALAGFLKGAGLESIEQAELRETAKGSFYFAVRRIPGLPATEVLPDILLRVLRAQSWPKSMRWAENQFRWVRPIHGILALFDGKPLAGSLDLGQDAIDFEGTTCGHVFMAPGAFPVRDFADYREKLRAAKVVVDGAERREMITAAALALAEEEGLQLKQDEGLLREVSGLVEWPVVLMGKIDRRFLSLPREVLSTSMKVHQKYFTLLDADGDVAERFLLVADKETADQGVTIRAGNERVLRARLSDAEFFWEQDRKRRLDTRVADLDAIVFHAKLGSMLEKAMRLQDLARDLAQRLALDETETAARAGLLAKADLTTDMVGEFPELQGIMGRYYALHDGEAPALAEALATHYAPQGPGDGCPQAPVSVALALADKLDSLVGFFAIGEKPTGSRDPFGLRRAALGIIRLIVENNLRLPLLTVLSQAMGHYGRRISGGPDLPDEVLDFLADRLKIALRDQGVRHDLIAAVFATRGPAGEREDDLVRILSRVAALETFLASDDGANILVAYRRAANIARIESKKDGRSYDGELRADLLVAEEERDLVDCLQTAGTDSDACLQEEDFAGAMSALARLRKPVDAFFDEVTVNAEDAALRENRLFLLSRIETILDRVADFSKVEG
jgi:glycyl-tRNA synthetase beta chain